MLVLTILQLLSSFARRLNLSHMFGGIATLVCSILSCSCIFLLHMADRSSQRSSQQTRQQDNPEQTPQGQDVQNSSSQNQDSQDHDSQNSPSRTAKPDHWYSWISSFLHQREHSHTSPYQVSRNPDSENLGSQGPVSTHRSGGEGWYFFGGRPNCPPRPPKPKPKPTTEFHRFKIDYFQKHSHTFTQRDYRNMASSSSNVVGVHYRVGKKIGEGSFGVIFEGTNLLNNSQVAIKFVGSELLLQS